MPDKCIKDPFDQCFHDCEGCPQFDKEEFDIDYLRDIYNNKDKDE